MINRLILIFTAALTCAAHADEGFDVVPPNPALAAAADSTFLLFFGTTGDIAVGSGFVVRRDGNNLDLLTADHVLGTDCDDHACPDLRVFRTVHFPWSRRNEVRANSIARSVVVLARDHAQDLAVLRLQLNEPVAAPLIIASQCQPEYRAAVAIGFPVTADRESVVNISEAKFLTKRFSRGHVITAAGVRPNGSVIMATEVGTRSVLATTVDAMSGSSGGPLVSEEGAVLGLVDREVGSDQHEYKGRGKAASTQFNALVIPCEQINAFLSSIH